MAPKIDQLLYSYLPLEPKHVLSCNTRGEVEVLQFVAKADSSGYGGCSKAMGSKHHDWEHR